MIAECPPSVVRPPSGYESHARGRPLSGKGPAQRAFGGFGLTYRERLLAVEQERFEVLRDSARAATRRRAP